MGCLVNIEGMKVIFLNKTLATSAKILLILPNVDTNDKSNQVAYLSHTVNSDTETRFKARPPIFGASLF